MLIKPKKASLNNIPSNIIRDNLDEILDKIAAEISTPEFQINVDERQAVQLCLKRVLAVIRNEDLVENYFEALCRVWEACLKHQLTTTSKYEAEFPHVAIATDVANCLFQKYNKATVMKRVVPIAVQFLSKNNTALTQLITVRLCHVTMEMSDLIAPHLEEIMNCLKTTKMPVLCRILPHVFKQAPKEIIENTNVIIHHLSKADIVEKVAILQTLRSIAQTEPAAVKPYKDVLLNYLGDDNTDMLILDACTALAKDDPLIFINSLKDIVAACNSDSTLIIYELSIKGSIGLHDSANAKSMLMNLSKMLKTKDEALHPLIAGEMKKIGTRYPDEMRPRLSSMVFMTGRARSTSVKASLEDLNLDDYVEYIKTTTKDPNENNERKKAFDKKFVQSAILEEETVVGSKEAKNEPGPSETNKTISHYSSNGNSVIIAKEPKEPVNTAVEVANALDINQIKIFVLETVRYLPILRAFSRSSIGENEIILHFKCSKRGPGCLFSTNMFNVKTAQVNDWMKFSFCAMKAGKANWKQSGKRADEVIQNFSVALSDPFVKIKNRHKMVEELRKRGYYNIFEFNKSSKSWFCYVCSHPDKAQEILRNGVIWLAGKLKKKGQNFTQFWHERFFKISDGCLVNKKDNDESDTKTIHLKDIFEVQLAEECTNENAIFEIRTEDKRYILKAEDRVTAEKWVTCLTLSAVIAENGALDLSPRY